MALYILEDKSIHPFLSKRTSQEISAVKSLNQRRIPTKSITDMSDLSVLLSDSEAIFLIPYTIVEEILPAVEFCNLNSVPVIAMHSIPDFAPEYIYNSTGSNNWFLFSKIISNFLKYGKRKIAYFGMNPNSSSDRVKAHHIYDIYQPFSSDDIFYIKTSIAECFEGFVAEKDNYDAVICPNDFIAVALMKRLASADPNYVNSHFVIGFMDSYIAKLYHTTITSVTYDMKAVLNAISSIYRTINKNRQSFNSINIQLPNLIISRASTQNKPFSYGQALYKNLSDTKPPLILPNANGFTYENDAEMSAILKIENMFENIGNLDFKIIYELLSGSTNHIISEKLFISQQTLQYHTSQLFSSVYAKTKSDFIRILSEYVNTENLNNFISNGF